jgi:LysM repeat protein
MTDTPMPTATFTPTPTATPITYSVQSGDYPVLIAELYNVPVDELITLNNLEETGLQVGQVLIIPPSAPAATAAAAAGPTPETITYIIESGDTLLGIALEYDTTVEDIAAVNPDTSLDLIFPGQEILVPLAPPTITPTPTIPPTATATPGPAYPSPDLLSPAAGQSVDDDALVFQWTSTTLLAPDEYYVLQLTWANGDRTQAWLKNNGWRITKTQRPANGLITWSVTLMRQTGTHTDGQPTGFSLSFPGEQRPIEWR